MSEFDAPPTYEDEAVTEPVTGNLLAPVAMRVMEANEDSPTDQLLEIYESIRFYQANLKLAKKTVEEALIARIIRDGDITVGQGVRYYVGTVKTTKCTNVPAALQATMEATGGDWTATCAILSSNAIKHGAAKKVLKPDVWAKLFETKQRETLEGEPAEPTLQRFDERFVR